ncbi:hypothetical protein EBR43_12160 [bacterium]|nr:hypothetical protein [bacterium]
MIKRKKLKPKVKPYFHNDNIYVSYEFEHKKNKVQPGDLLKIKYERGVFRFIKLVHNRDKDVTWIDCMDKTTGEFRSFYLDKIKGLHVAKVSRKKKENV